MPWCKKEGLLFTLLEAKRYTIALAEAGTGADTCMGSDGWCEKTDADRYTVWAYGSRSLQLTRKANTCAGCVVSQTEDGDEIKCLTVLHENDPDVASMLRAGVPTVTIEFRAPVVAISQAGNTYFVDARGQTVAALLL